MNNLAIRFDVRSKMLLFRGKFKELQTRVGVQPKLSEDGVKQVVGEIECEVGDGVGTPENEEAAYPVD